MTIQRKALKLALEALVWATSCMSFEDFDDMPEALEELNKAHQAITAIKEALAQPEPSPEWMTEEEQTAYTFGWFKALESQRTWVGLTDEEIAELWYDFRDRDMGYAMRFAHVLEAKLKEKNT